MYYVPVERLRKNEEFSAGFFAKQFTATAQFGPKAKESFDLFNKATNDIFNASIMLISRVDQPSRDDQKVKDELLDVIWVSGARVWGREDKIETQIEQAVTNLEAICRPVLERTTS